MKPKKETVKVANELTQKKRIKKDKAYETTSSTTFHHPRHLHFSLASIYHECTNNNPKTFLFSLLNLILSNQTIENKRYHLCNCKDLI